MPDNNIQRAPFPPDGTDEIVSRFGTKGAPKKIVQITKGYINRTYFVETKSDDGTAGKYLLQRINTNVFGDPDLLMANYRLTTEHLYGKLRLPGTRGTGAVQKLVLTKNGEPFLRDDSGCWRMLSFFDHVYSLDIPDSPDTFYNAGRTFGLFLREMSDVDPADVGVVIPNFHNTFSRYLDLESAVSADPAGRVAGVCDEIAFYRRRRACFGVISSAIDGGVIPLRVCHNDCNLNNVLFDETTHLPVALIDLDTVMPSTPLYDFGDSIRVGTNTARDDEKDLSKVDFDIGLYERYARGYLEECGDMLTPDELRLLPLSSLVITSEDGIRFLADYVNGDTYYSTSYPGQNLDRCRTQLTLLAAMERRLADIVGILNEIYSGLHLGVTLSADETAKLWSVSE